LAYRQWLNELPGCGVDGMTWTIRNIKDEPKFGWHTFFHLFQKKWGEKVHGMELFNDFT
jgi:hypothetical protein